MCRGRKAIAISAFTSHYVPIKSDYNFVRSNGISDLHPIMFLLNRCASNSASHNSAVFTSHYVPIKSIYTTYGK